MCFFCLILWEIILYSKHSCFVWAVNGHHGQQNAMQNRNSILIYSKFMEFWLNEILPNSCGISLLSQMTKKLIIGVVLVWIFCPIGAIFAPKFSIIKGLKSFFAELQYYNRMSYWYQLNFVILNIFY